MSDISFYREPFTRAVALTANPPIHATDNGVLFSAVACQLGLITQADFVDTASEYLTSQAGDAFILRYPYSPNYMSWDDHVGYITTANGRSKYVKRALLFNLMRTPDKNFLGRFVILDALVMPFLFPLAAIAYLVDNAPAEQTSGRQLLWLAGRHFYKTNWLMRPVLWWWKKRMMKLYPQGLKSLFAVYYQDPNHPFHAAAPGDFN